MDIKELGNLGEKIACEYLVKKGFKILERNYRISFGEIDIIAKKKFNLFNKNHKTVHFVEVKTIIGSNDSFYPEERVDYRKKKKLIGLCQIWLDKNNLPQNYPYQIDVVGILFNEKTQKARISYFPNAVADI